MHRFNPPETRTVERTLWRLLALGLVALGLLFALTPLRAQNVSPKVSQDLQAVIAMPTTPKLNWTKDVSGVRMVKALVVSNASDPDLTALRTAVIGHGGSVYLRYVSVRALSVMLPARSVYTLAARSDVQSISPNRLTARTASTLEASSGALSPAVRSYSGTTGYSGLDGTGIGIAVLDSGVMFNHRNMLDAAGKSRVRRAVDMQKVGDATALGLKDWVAGIDVSASLYPGSPTMATYESKIDNDQQNMVDKYGHGSHVASVAAGRGFYQAPDSTGIAPGADIYDVKVLSDAGYGQVSDVLAGIDWVIYHAREYNIRVMNLSLAADSTETWQTDPLARAARSAVAAGITVIAAGGNYGRSATGAEQFGAISSPGHDPSVITVGSANTRGTAVRNDDTINLFSSRGPTRGSWVDAAGVRRYDHLLKPDLVAPGNRILGTMWTDKAGGVWSWLAATYRSALPYDPNYKKSAVKSTLMYLSGTSVAAPAVAGTVALMLQANPGLTPPLIKAILQYSAQPVAGASLLQQGAGLLNVDGAVRLAQALRTDVATAVEAGTLAAGADLLAPGRVLPQPSSTVNGQTFAWGRIVFVGGRHLVSGETLFTRYQPVYDPRLVWVGSTVRRNTVSYWPVTSGTAADSYVRAIVEAPAAGQTLLTAGVLSATPLTGPSSWLGQSGAFIPGSLLSGWLASGSGLMMSEGVVLSEGLVMSEGLMMSEGLVMSESGQTAVTGKDDSSLLGEP